MYAFESKVRYSEVGEDTRMTLYSVLNYFQDCSVFHSESVGKVRPCRKNWEEPGC